MKTNKVVAFSGLLLMTTLVVVYGADDTKPALVYFTEINLSVRDKINDKTY